MSALPCGDCKGKCCTFPVFSDKELYLARIQIGEAMNHGHVVPNKDGSKARCGGPGFCMECSLEADQKKLDGMTPSKREEHPPRPEAPPIPNLLLARSVVFDLTGTEGYSMWPEHIAYVPEESVRAALAKDALRIEELVDYATKCEGKILDMESKMEDMAMALEGRRKAREKGWWMELDLEELREEFACLEEIEIENQKACKELGADITEKSTDGIWKLGNMLHAERERTQKIVGELAKVREALEWCANAQHLEASKYKASGALTALDGILGTQKDGGVR